MTDIQMNNLTDIPSDVIDKSDIEIVYDKIRKSVDVENISAADIGIIIQKVVQILTKNSELAGEEKRKLVEYVITRLYSEIPESNNQKVAIFQISSIYRSWITHNYSQIV